MKKVAVVTRLTNPGGVPSCALSLIKGLNARAIIPDVVWDLPPSQELLRDAGVTAGFKYVRMPVPTLQLQRLPESLRYLAWIANGRRAERHLLGYDFAFSFNQVYLLAGMPHLYFLSGPPLLPQLDIPPEGWRGIPFRAFRWAYRAFLRRMKPVYDYVPGSVMVINSHYTARLFEEAHGIQLPVVHPPMRAGQQVFRPNDWAARDSALFFSRIVPYKRPEMLFELAEHHPGLRWVIMGGCEPHHRPYLDSLRVEAASRGVRFSFVVNPDNAKVEEELARARYYIFPAINEHFGMTTPEAIARGVVPFVHNSGGQVESVPLADLRFADEEFKDKFHVLVNLSEDRVHRIREELRRHVQRYDESVFIEKMLAYMDNA
jgi:glycosyltransferase involved in cell wall biosynthesis